MSSSSPESTDLNNSTRNDFMIHRFVDPFLLQRDVRNKMNVGQYNSCIDL